MKEKLVYTSDPTNRLFNPRLSRSEVIGIGQSKENILSEQWRRTLSIHAVRLYELIWYTRRFTNRRVVVHDFESLQKKLWVPPDKIPKAIDSLVRHGLLRVHGSNSDGYELLENTALGIAAELTDEEAWHLATSNLG